MVCYSTQEKYREIASAYEEIRYAIEDEINRIVQIGVEGHEDLLDELNKQLEETTNNINDTNANSHYTSQRVKEQYDTAAMQARVDEYKIANQSVVPNITVGDININNPVGNSDDLARELMMNLANAIERKTYSNLKKF